MHNKFWPLAAVTHNTVLYNFVLGISCALLFLGPFFFPTHLWLLLFFFPVPFLLATAHTRFSFFTLYTWSILILCIQSWGVLWGIFNLSSGPLCIRLFPLLVLLGTQALYPATIFWGTQNILARNRPLGIGPRLCIWLITLWVVFLILIHMGLRYAGAWEGYPLINPLLPLATRPELLTAILPLLGTDLTLLLMLSFSVPLAYMLSTKTPRGLWISLFLTLPWLTSGALHQTTAGGDSSWTKQTVVFVGSPKTALAHADLLRRTRYLFFPESTCTGSVAPLCDLAAQLPNCTIVAGGFRNDHGTHRNTAWWLHGTIQGCCDKRHAMPLAERVPFLIDIPAIRAAYFHHIAEVIPSEKARPRWQLSEKLTIVPYLCSELFCFTEPDDPYHDPILALCYDSWPTARYAQELLLLTARFKAIAWKRDIIYVGYAFQALCSKNGNTSPLSVSGIKKLQYICEKERFSTIPLRNDAKNATIRL